MRAVYRSLRGVGATELSPTECVRSPIAVLMVGVLFQRFEQVLVRTGNKSSNGASFDSVPFHP